MPVEFRFSRLRSGALRLRLKATGEDIEVFGRYVASGWCQPLGGEPYVPVTLEADRIETVLARLEAVSPAYGDLVAKVRVVRARLDAKVLPVKGADDLDDPVLRQLVHARSVRQGAVVIDELGITAAAVRVDIASLSEDCWMGVELKGENDSLVRLPRQVAAYGAVFDTCEVVTVEHHLDGVRRLVPDWWQLSRVTAGRVLEVVRPGGLNPAPSALARAHLLWRDEAFGELRRLGLARGMSSARRDELQGALAQVLDAREMREVVTARIRARSGWLEPGGRKLG